LTSYSKFAIFAAAQVFIGFIISIYIESVSNGNLLFTEGILHDHLRMAIINHPKTVLCVLGLVNFAVYYGVEKRRSADYQNKIFDNLCSSIFSKFLLFNSRPNLDETKIRVIFFIANEKYVLCNKKILKKELLLMPIAQFQNKHSSRVCINYRCNEGCVGLSFSMRKFTQIHIRKTTNPEVYYADCSDKLAMPIKKVKKLTDMPILLLSFPIRFFRSEELFGVISIELESKIEFTPEDARYIEDIVSNFSPFFQKKI